MSKLWVEKYKPKSFSEFVDQEQPIKKFRKLVINFKRGKAVFIYGPPGIGKSLSCEILARELNYTLFVINASDNRAAKNIESMLSTVIRQSPLFYRGVLICIDEIDGMAKSDKGAIQKILRIIRTSKFPIVLIANDPYKGQLKELRNASILIQFNKIKVYNIEKFLKRICDMEGIKVEQNVLRELAKWSNGDLRSAIMDLQTIAYGKREITIDDLSILGFRDRERDIFRVLGAIFFSNINAARFAINESNRDPDEIFVWVIENIPNLVCKKNIANVYELMSIANYYRSLVRRQQNWRLKLYMIDLLSLVNVFVSEHKFVRFVPSRRIGMMYLTKKDRTNKLEFVKKLAKYCHCSKKTIIKFYLPYLRTIIRTGKGYESGIKIDKEEISLIV